MKLKLFSVVLLCTLMVSAESKHKESRKESPESHLILPEPYAHVKSKHGRLLVWPEDTAAFKEIGVRALVVEVDSNGLVLPMYVNAHSLCYVTQGRATAGVIKPSGEPTNTRYLRTGDVLALPAGWTVWLHNTGRMEVKMFCVNKPLVGKDCGECHAFFLAGAKAKNAGSFLHGFSDQILSRMFDLTMKDARETVEAQQSTVFANGKESSNVFEYEQTMQGDLAFNMELARPEIIEYGGRMTLVDDTKMQVLKELGFGAVLMKLNPNSMVSPQWLLGAGQIVYVTKGAGCVQVVSPQGHAVLNETLQADGVFVIPPFHPHVVVNKGDSPMEWICIHFTSRFYPSFLSGAQSVYGSIPLEYLVGAFNTSEELVERVREARQDEKMFYDLGVGVITL